MLFTSTTQFVALGVALIAGWLLGLASHPGGRKWKQRYADERTAHAAARKDQDARLSETNVRAKDLERDAARVQELERENARLREREAENARLGGTRSALAPRERGVAPLQRDRKAGWFDWNRPAGQ